MTYIFGILFLLVVVSLLSISKAVNEIRELLQKDLWESWGDMVRRTFGGENEIIVKPISSRKKKKEGFGPNDPPRM